MARRFTDTGVPTMKPLIITDAVRRELRWFMFLVLMLFLFDIWLEHVDYRIAADTCSVVDSRLKLEISRY